MNIDDDDIAAAQQLAYAINDLFIGCTPAAICTAIGTVLGCAECDDTDVLSYLTQIATVVKIVRTKARELEEAEDEDEMPDNVIPFRMN